MALWAKQLPRGIEPLRSPPSSAFAALRPLLPQREKEEALPDRFGKDGMPFI
jgi:hypothetical protein